MKNLIIMLALCCVVVSSEAQLNRSAYGIYGQYVYAMHNANFQSLPSLPCCSPIFDGGSGNGAGFGLLYQTPLGPSWTLSGRVGYVSYGGTQLHNEATTVSVNGSAVPGNIEHKIDASLAALSLEPMIGYRLTDRFTLHGGLLLGSVMTKTMVQTEHLTTPSQGALTVPAQVYSGDIPNGSSLYAAADFGLSFDIPLFTGSRWFLAPEAYFSIPFTKVASDVDWKVSMLRAGFALKYSPSPLVMPVAPLGQKAKLIAAVKAYGLNSSDAAEEPIVKIKVEEFLSRTHKPLLPYIFFGAGSAELPLQYHQLPAEQTSAFNPETFNDSTLLGVYYDMLNIIGKRMREHPNAKLTLMGCNSNETTEKNNLALSQRRAETVKSYLVSHWSIDASRIDTKSRNLPANPSNINKEEGIAENRRVEIVSTDPDIIAPLITRDTTRISSPPIVRFVSQTESEAGIGAYSLAATQNNHLIQAFNGKNDVPERIDWRLEDNPTTMPRAETPLSYTLRVTDKTGQDYTTEVQQIPVEQMTIEKRKRERLGDKEIVRYTLMSFGYNQAEVEPDNLRYLDQVKQDIGPNSTVNITGSTDTMGDEDFNMNLSQQRAKSVSKVLKPGNGEVRGVGEQTTFDNGLPEGRFYNRTVRVNIETPIQR